MIRLLIADDHPVVREGLRRLITDATDMTVVAEAATGSEVVDQALRSDLDVVLLDISMPGPGFLEVMRQVRERRRNLPILVLSAHPEDRYALRALRSGAAGYLTKSRSPEELVEAIRKVYGGGRYVTATLAEKLAFNVTEESEPRPHHQLSDREYQVLVRLAGGKLVKEIAAELDLSPKTVSTYRTRILEKLELSTTADLVRYALEHDLLGEPT